MDMGRLAVIKNRIYSDYFMPSRLKEYEKVIKILCEIGYEHITFRDYNKKLKTNSLENKKYFINRHDIDTDVKTAKKFFEIEKKYNVKATFYFRLSTLDFEFMKEIEEYGSETSYHFEEIATYAKRNHIKSKDEIITHLDKIKEEFKQNFQMIESKMEGKKLQTVCSHGDFANRKLGIVNNMITRDLKLREELGIECETYDKDIMNSFDIYLSDGAFSLDATAQDIIKMIDNKNRICMLTHPRQWNVSWLCNTKENIKRLYEGLVW
jgi:hypothetical protein